MGILESEAASSPPALQLAFVTPAWAGASSSCPFQSLVLQEEAGAEGVSQGSSQEVAKGTWTFVSFQEMKAAVGLCEAPASPPGN